MSSVIYYDPNSSPVANAVTNYIPSVDLPPTGNVLVNSDATLLNENPWKYLKVSGGVVVLMSTQEKASVDGALAAADTATARSSAQSIIASTTDVGKVDRAIVDTLLSDRNNLVTWMINTNANIAAATSLANLQTRQASNPAPSPATLAAVKTAISNDIASGNVD